MPIQMANHSYLSGVLFRKIITDNVNYLNRLHQHHIIRKLRFLKIVYLLNKKKFICVFANKPILIFSLIQ